MQETQAQGSDDFESPHAKPYFLYVGRLEKLKGVQILIDVFPNTIAQTCSSRARVVLNRNFGIWPRGFRTCRSWEDSITFGWRLFTSTQWQSCPSLCFETFGFTAIEAFARRTPVIVHNLGALPEVAQSGGFVYENQQELLEAMEKLRTDPKLREKMGEDGYSSYLNHYTEAHHLTSYYDLISEIAARQKAKATA